MGAAGTETQDCPSNVLTFNAWGAGLCSQHCRFALATPQPHCPCKEESARDSGLHYVIGTAHEAPGVIAHLSPRRNFLLCDLSLAKQRATTKPSPSCPSPPL